MRQVLMLLVGVAIGAGGLFGAQKLMRAEHGSIFTAIDGDTVRINHLRVTNQTIRAAGYDTPEIRRAKCSEEKQAGVLIRDRIQTAIAAGTFTVELTGRRAGFGRPEAIFRINGRDFGPILMSQGLAVQWRRGVKTDWCNRLTRRDVAIAKQ